MGTNVCVLCAVGYRALERCISLYRCLIRACARCRSRSSFKSFVTANERWHSNLFLVQLCFSVKRMSVDPRVHNNSVEDTFVDVQQSNTRENR